MPKRFVLARSVASLTEASLAIFVVAGLSAAAAVQAPVLKWQKGGCYTTWCETGWYSSPAVADIDQDGKMEVIAATYSVVSLDGATGGLEWRIDPTGDRVWPGVVISDVNDDGLPEVVTGHGGGYVNVTDGDGNNVWTRRPSTNEIRSLAVSDIDADGLPEIVAGAAIGSAVNTWVIENNGNTAAGWPQLSNATGYAWGVYNANIAVADLDHDGYGEIVVPSDVHYICAYERNGVQIPGNAMYGAGKAWGKVGVWESLEVEIRGWGECDGVRKESYRTNFAHGPSAIADVNGDGTVEVVVTGNVYDCFVGDPEGSRYTGVYLFNADRSRFDAGGRDWSAPPVDTGGPLSMDYAVIENAQANPAVADLDGDGEQEILYSAYDGRVHAFWLDKTEHGAWPFEVYHAAEGIYRFASEPAVADLDNDGQAEVLVASWTEHGSNKTGKLHIVDSGGHALFEVNLPAAVGGPNWNGALAAPTVADIDGDGELEAVVNTANSGVVAYDLPGTTSARVLWGTGRGNFGRTGAEAPSLAGSSKTVDKHRPAGGETVTFTVVIAASVGGFRSVHMADVIPSGLTYAGNLSYSAGAASYAAGTVTWTGNVPPGIPVDISFDAAVSGAIVDPRAITNTALITNPQGDILRRSTTVMVNGTGTFIPFVVNP